MKKFKLFLTTALFVFSFVSCGTSASRGENRPSVSGNSGNVCSSHESRPDWAQESLIETSGSVVFVGVSTNKGTEEESKQSAIQNALGNISKYFGVSVSATFSEKRSKVNGKRDSQIFSTSQSTSRQIDIQEYSYEGKPVVTCTNSGYVAYVKVAVPKTELARIKIKLDSFGVWAIKSDIPEAAARIRDLFPVFGTHGVNINEQTDYSLKTPKQVFAENKKAFYLKIEVNETKTEEYSGEFYSVIEINAELFNLLTAETINRWRVESKGAAYSAKEARENGIAKAVQKIINQI